LDSRACCCLNGPLDVFPDRPRRPDEPQRARAWWWTAADSSEITHGVDAVRRSSASFDHADGEAGADALTEAVAVKRMIRPGKPDSARMLGFGDGRAIAKIGPR